MVKRRAVVEGDVAGRGRQVKVDEDAGLEIGLRRVDEAGIGRCRRQGEVLDRGCAVIDDDVRRSGCYKAGLARRDRRIGSRWKTGEGIRAACIGRRRAAAKHDRDATDWRATDARRHRALQGAAASRRAGGIGKGTDAGLVIESVRCIVFICVPERAAVGIQRHRAVVAPACAGAAARSGLRTGTLDQHLFGLAERVDRIAGKAAGVLDGRLGRRTRRAVAESEVAEAIDGDAWHEAMHDVGRIGIPGCRLRNVRRNHTAGHSDLVPAWRSKARRVGPSHGMSGP